MSCTQCEVLHRELAQAYEQLQQRRDRIAVLEAGLAQLDAMLSDMNTSKREASE